MRPRSVEKLPPRPNPSIRNLNCNFSYLTVTKLGRHAESKSDLFDPDLQVSFLESRWIIDIFIQEVLSVISKQNFIFKNKSQMVKGWVFWVEII